MSPNHKAREEEMGEIISEDLIEKGEASLREQLGEEKRRNEGLENEVLKLRISLVKLGKDTEIEEDYITNRLIKKLKQLEEEKAKLLITVENEEEYISNKLQKQVRDLREEKVELENVLETEQENMVNRLQIVLSKIKQEKEEIEKKYYELKEGGMSEEGKEREKPIIEEFCNGLIQYIEGLQRSIEEKRERETETDVDTKTETKGKEEGSNESTVLCRSIIHEIQNRKKEYVHNDVKENTEA